MIVISRLRLLKHIVVITAVNIAVNIMLSLLKDIFVASDMSLNLLHSIDISVHKTLLLLMLLLLLMNNIVIIYRGLKMAMRTINVNQMRETDVASVDIALVNVAAVDVAAVDVDAVDVDAAVDIAGADAAADIAAAAGE
ncbi:hypothetical protein EMPG_10622 [Blastomyces silverae]|uniref:Uncharacterized protein n=1 Tax=Blastomyces silverae TaxID=2060906 RepID=A0A0H1B3D8_9EURO|nr:hypothetical protein EMPG_10622 [Blastomyces silverae]